MKKALITSYIEGIFEQKKGDSYGTIIRYFLPEFVTAFLLYSMPYWLDAHFISHLKSTSSYATLGSTNNLLHFIIKVAEALAVSTIIVGGQFNGRGQYEQVGRTLRDAFWVTFISGLLFASFLYFGAYYIYLWYGVPAEIIHLGIPFLRLRAVGIFFMFVFFAFIGFLRGIKNTKTPMQIFILGTTVFLFFDYTLIFGKLGFPALGLQGSALASVLQYVVMLIAAVGYIVFDPNNRKYCIDLFAVFSGGPSQVWRLLMLSWPVVLDKATMAWAYIWLCKMINPMGTACVASFCVIKDMERFAFLPAIAFAQVITFLVSNDLGARDWQGIKANIKKVVFLSSISVFGLLFIFSMYPEFVIRFFDQKGDFTTFAARSFPIISIFVFFDLLQLVLASALRGAGNVQTVMVVRFVVCAVYFVPVSYLIAQLPMENVMLKFIMIYSSFYIGNGLMSLAYIKRFRGEQWKVVASE